MINKKQLNQPVDNEVIGALAGKLTVLACCIFGTSMFFSVISLRCLYGDGSYQLTEVLKAAILWKSPKTGIALRLFFNFPWFWRLSWA